MPTVFRTMHEDLSPLCLDKPRLPAAIIAVTTAAMLGPRLEYWVLALESVSAWLVNVVLMLKATQQGHTLLWDRSEIAVLAPAHGPTVLALAVVIALGFGLWRAISWRRTLGLAGLALGAFAGMAALRTLLAWPLAAGPAMEIGGWHGIADIIALSTGFFALSLSCDAISRR